MRFKAEDMIYSNFSLEIEHLHHGMKQEEGVIQMEDEPLQQKRTQH